MDIKKLDLDDISNEISDVCSKVSDVEYEIDKLKGKYEVIREIEDFIYECSIGSYDINDEGEKLADNLWRKY